MIRVSSVIFWGVVLAVFLLSGHQYYHTFIEPDRDEKAFVHPQYYLFSNLRACPECAKYKLLLYREGSMAQSVHRDGRPENVTLDAQEQALFQAMKFPSYVFRAQPELLSLEGWPVLFVHGHGGSYRQARALGAEAGRSEMLGPDSATWGLFEQLKELRLSGRLDSRHGKLDVFAVDFDEAWSALTGYEVTSQANYVHFVTRYILSLYAARQSRTDQTVVPPDHVIIVSHSMGTLATRLSILINNENENESKSGSNTARSLSPVQVILSLAAPHSSPLISLEPSLASIYDRVARFEAAQPEILRPAIVSVLGGTRDKTIPSSLSYIQAKPDHVLNVWATSIPYVWSSMGHDIIIWSHAFIRAVIETLHALVLAERQRDCLDGTERRLSTQDRLAIFRARLVPHDHSITSPVPTSPIAFSLRQPVCFSDTWSYFSKSRVELDALFGNASYALLALNETRQLSLLTNLKLGVNFLFLRGRRTSDTLFVLSESAFPFDIDTSYYLPYSLELRYPGFAFHYNSIMTRIETTVHASSEAQTFLLLCKEACLVSSGQFISSPILAEEGGNASSLSLPLLNALLPESALLHASEYERPELFSLYYSDREKENARRRKFGHPDHFLILSHPGTETLVRLAFSWIEWLWMGTEMVFPAGTTNGLVTLDTPASLDSRIWVARLCIVPASDTVPVMQPVLQHRSLTTGESKVWVGSGCTSFANIPIPGAFRQSGTIKLHLDPNVAYRVTWKADLLASFVWTFRHYWLYDCVIVPYCILVLLLAISLYGCLSRKQVSSPLASWKALMRVTPMACFIMWICAYYAEQTGLLWSLDVSGSPAPLPVYYQAYLRGMLLVYLFIGLWHVVIAGLARAMLVIHRSFWLVSLKPLYLVVGGVAVPMLSGHATFVLLYIGYLLEVVKMKCRLLSLQRSLAKEATGHSSAELANAEALYYRQLALFHILSFLCCIKVPLVVSWIRDCVRDFHSYFWHCEEGRFIGLAPFFIYLWLESSGPLDWHCLMPRSFQTSTLLKMGYMSMLLLWCLAAFVCGAQHVYLLHEWTQHMLSFVIIVYLSLKHVPL